jgi:hypothetical protein
MNYEVKTKDAIEHTYGVWNNDMKAFQYVHDWNGAETLDLETANKVCQRLNDGNYGKQVGSFGGMGMGTF